MSLLLLVAQRSLLKPGDYFGEYSFFTGENRRASVSALSDLQLIVLEGEAFHSFIEYNEDVEAQINLNALQRSNSLDHMRHNIAARESAELRLSKMQDRVKM